MSGLSNFFENLKVGKKLMLGFGLILLLSLAVAICGIKNLNDISVRAEKLRELKSVNDRFSQAKDARLQFVKTHDEKFIVLNEDMLKEVDQNLKNLGVFRWDDSQQAMITAMPSAIATYRQKRAGTVQAVRDGTQALTNLSVADEMRAIGQLAASNNGDAQTAAALQEINKHLSGVAVRVKLFGLEHKDEDRNVLSSFLTETVGLIAQIKSRLTPADAAAIDKISEQLVTKQADISAMMASVKAGEEATAELAAAGKTLTDMSNALFTQQLDATNHDARQAVWLMATIVIGAIIAGILIALFITRQLTRPLSELLHIARQMARGDLSTVMHTSRRDELGELMHAVGEMSDELRRIISGIRSGVTSVSQASAEIASGNNDLSARTESQAAALAQTAASMEQLTSTVKQNADNIHHSSRLAQETFDTASRGGQLVTSVVSTMNEISASSGKISEITSVINSIAFQTNILALNAAVEAARAGEQGRGFAVVASEVRNLAQRSALAAKEIETLIQDSVARISAGSQLVSQTGNTMGEIVTSVSNVTEILNEISQASEEQNRGIAQVGVAIVEMDNVTQQNAALVEQSSAAASALHDQAQTLAGSVSRFVIA
ncbi:methyl-accepting chemotaxis protein [Pantoea allii]|uniref:HAMP domain-containing protein n=1 Tax=Pantoea allii TaxID=574096 RepID=A0ABS6VEL8_9GAMM|nr:MULTISPECIES: methyl-accepting chemotaxis protein [Pantoea]MBW1214298.1 HAMP domain-containing protein [Pantoea allii]MBW1252441.1 HAMP domain-containing protein [Pantoea allii]MBW1257580.1 HAMP domain-containing protein [Pantoea allii]MBW1261788.1 HAMP domain-containing protein [Pantoea allii]MBW1266591.1 HAMP domain-containing protein [Pantoea allii]